MSKLSQKYQKLADLKPPEKEAGATLTLYPCIVCHKPIGEGYYGAWGDRGVCSKSCNTIQSQKPKYPPPHDEESYLKRQEKLK